MNESGADSDQKAYEGFKLPTNSTSSSPELLHIFLETASSCIGPKKSTPNHLSPAMGVVTF